MLANNCFVCIFEKLPPYDWIVERAYKVYEKEIKGQGFGPWKFENIIMSSEGEKFPIAQYKVEFTFLGRRLQSTCFYV